MKPLSARAAIFITAALCCCATIVAADWAQGAKEGNFGKVDSIDSIISAHYQRFLAEQNQASERSGTPTTEFWVAWVGLPNWLRFEIFIGSPIFPTPKHHLFCGFFTDPRFIKLDASRAPRAPFRGVCSFVRPHVPSALRGA